MRPQAGRWFAAPLAVAAVMTLLNASIALGIGFRSHGSLGSLPSGSGLDYGRGFLGSFAPLSRAFIERVLGSALPAYGVGSSVVLGAGGLGEDPLAGDTGGERLVDVHALTNDRISDARDIPAIPFTARTDTRQATRDGSDPSDCSSVGPTVWYRYAPKRDSLLSAYTFGTDHAAALGVFEGKPGALRSVGCDTDAAGNAFTAFRASAGTVYYFQITAYLGGGDLVFSLDPHGRITLASMSEQGKAANDQSWVSGLSADGRYVGFMSRASDLTPEADSKACRTRNPSDPILFVPPGPCFQAYVHDRTIRKTTLVSASSSGTANSDVMGPFISGNGRYAVFETGATNMLPNDTAQSYDLWLKDLETRRLELIASCPMADHLCAALVYSGGNASYLASTSDDARYVAFQSPYPFVEDDTNDVVDVFVFDRLVRRFERVSVSSYEQQSDNTVQKGGADVTTDSTIDLTPVISGDGRYVRFRSPAANLVPGDTNGAWDTFVRDRLTRTTERVSVSSSGQQANGDSTSQYLVVSAFSDDGRHVVFGSKATNLVPGDSNNGADVFVRDRVAGTTVRVTVTSTGEQQRGQGQTSQFSTISGTGRYILFDSDAPNLAPGDEDGALHDVFVRDLLTGTTKVVTVDPAGGNSWGYIGGISRDGRTIALGSEDPVLSGDPKAFHNVYVYEGRR